MIYTVIFMDYKNDLVSEVCNESPDRHAAWKNIKQEYGSVLALVPGDHRDLHYPLRRQRQMCIRDRVISKA